MNVHKILQLLVISVLTPYVMKGEETVKAYDYDMAVEICRQLPLENVEGVWIYPEDKVTVLILAEEDTGRTNQLPSYTISVVETSDARIHPGEILGKLHATAEDNIYRIEIATEKKNDFLLKPKSVLATLSKDRDTFIIKKQKSPIKGRLNFNFSRLLPGFWKIVSIGASGNQNNNIQTPVGMVKVYPSYDGNGSSRRKIRYL